VYIGELAYVLSRAIAVNTIWVTSRGVIALHHQCRRRGKGSFRTTRLRRWWCSLPRDHPRRRCPTMPRPPATRGYQRAPVPTSCTWRPPAVSKVFGLTTTWFRPSVCAISATSTCSGATSWLSRPSTSRRSRGTPSACNTSTGWWPSIGAVANSYS